MRILSGIYPDVLPFLKGRWVRFTSFAAALWLVSGGALAQTAITNGVPVALPVVAGMDNNFAVDVTDIDFGTIVLTSASGETGELTMATDGSFDESANIDPVARVMAHNAAGQPGVLAIGGGLPDTVLFIRYGNVQNLTCSAGCTGSNPDIIVSRIEDNMPVQAGAWSADDADPDASAVAGQGFTDSSGALTVNIGASLRTEDTSDPYQPGDYDGSFDVILSY